MIKPIVASGVAILGSLVVVLSWPEPFVCLLRTTFPGVVWDAPSGRREVALTVDDGPDPIYTPKLLAILRGYNIKATFFLVGERARMFPHLVEAIRRDQHEVANHSDSWARTVTLSDHDFERDLLRAEATLGLATSKTKLFRPAGGLIRPSQLGLAQRHRYLCVLGSAYGLDAQGPPSWFIKWAILRAVRPGAIIVIHDSAGDRQKTLEALPGIVHETRRRELEFVPLSRLLERTKR